MLGRTTTKNEKRSANTLYQELSFQDNEESEENEVTGKSHPSATLNQNALLIVSPNQTNQHTKQAVGCIPASMRRPVSFCGDCSSSGMHWTNLMRSWVVNRTFDNQF